MDSQGVVQCQQQAPQLATPHRRVHQQHPLLVPPNPFMGSVEAKVGLGLHLVHLEVLAKYQILITLNAYLIDNGVLSLLVDKSIGVNSQWIYHPYLDRYQETIVDIYLINQYQALIVRMRYLVCYLPCIHLNATKAVAGESVKP